MKNGVEVGGILDKSTLEAWYLSSFERRSCRTFSGSDIPDEATDALGAIAANPMYAGGGARLVFLRGSALCNRVFSILGPLKVLKGATMTAVIIRDKQKKLSSYEVGFSGEQVVLEAARLRVASCWVSGTFSRGATRALVEVIDTEEIAAVIALGMPPLGYDWTPRSVTQARKKSFPSITNLTAKDAPEWARHAVLCAQYAPSAVNRQPWWFEFEHDRALGSLTLYAQNPASGRVSEPHDVSKLDHGIAMLHTMAGAAHAGYDGQWYMPASDQEFSPPRFIVR
jgi:hypothetical protein